MKKLLGIILGGILGGLVLTTSVSAQTPLSLGFDQIHLGMTLAQVKQELSHSGYFQWSGGPQVTLLAKPNNSLIDVPGISYFRRGVFQFHQGILFVASYDLNPQEFDYYGLYTALVKKYGQPGELDPSMAAWSDGKTRLSLERPLTIKYVDLTIEAKIKQNSQAGKDYQQISREKFLELF